jgi:4-amino-4-deoxy-L-arabinose transferase-like glycosyltransferase
MIAVFLGVGWAWIWNFRDPLLLDIDEAGYLRMSVNNLHALQAGGFENWLRAVFWPSPYAPVVPAITSLVMSAFGTDPRTGMMVPLFSAVVCAVATYGLALRLTRSHLAALLAVALFLSCQSLITYSRDFHYSVPAAAAMTSAIWFGTLSNGFRRLGWSIAFGVMMGLLPLSRSMTLAFVPGIFLGFGIAVLAGGLSWRQILNGLVAVIVCVVLVCLWLVPSWQLLTEYLITYGYGDRAGEYGPKSSFLSVDSWLMSVKILAYMVYLPQFFLLVAGALAWVIFAGRRVASVGKPRLRAILASPYLPPLVALLAGVTALTSSANKGSAFWLPLLPICFSFLAAAVVRFNHPWRGVCAGIIAAVSVVSFVPHIDRSSFLATEYDAEVPLLGGVRVSSGRGEFERYYAGIMGTTSAAADPIPAADRMAWKASLIEVGGYVTAQALPVAVTFRHFLLNANMLPLRGDLSGLPLTRYWMLDTHIAERNTAAYVQWLTGDAATACIVLISPGVEGEFMPANDSEAMTVAVNQLHFTKIKSWLLPGGRRIDAWQRCKAQS